jgi:tRNA dimethylallyltransferase
VLLVGGTGLHLRAIIDDLQPPPPFPQHRADLDANPDTASLYARLAALDPAAAAKMEPTNRRRIIRALEVCLGTGRPFSSFGPGLTAHPAVPYLLVALQWPRLLLDARIAARYEAQMAAGFLDEVRRLAGAPQPLSGTARQALGYRELLGHLAGEATLDEALDLARVRTRQFARRQERWFRRDPRIRWWPLAGGSSEVDPQLNPVEVAQALLEEWMHPTTES